MDYTVVNLGSGKFPTTWCI